MRFTMSTTPRLLAPFAGAAACLGLLAALAVLGGCGHRAAEAPTTAQAVLVAPTDVVLARAASLEAGIAFTGELAPSEIVQVNSRFDGDIDRVLVREGQAVRRGQPLAVYRPRDVEDRLRAAEAQLLAAEAGLRAAENAEARARRLFEAGAAASSELEAAEAQRTAARAALDQAQAMRNNAQEDAERLDVPSPIAGWVSRVAIHAGDRTLAGDPLFQIVDTDTLELSATVPSEALARVRPGAPIRFRVDAFPGEVFRGEVSRVNPTTEPGTRQLKVYTRVPNPDGRLVGGLFASGRVVDQVRANTTAAPVAVVRKEGSEQVVYRLRAGRAERVAVTLGLVDDELGLCELIGEVAPGDSLLTGILPGLRAGAQVNVLAGAAPAQD
jgi:membrane fusion protein (multidrug efflux system)